ncbi:hypothetical protein [Roseinatronobacter sp. NSM]|uniref:hypothetical protein n=1 Tax=Roseinatronobacter sp. NSM TaxID=3457785 RepID=UPI004036AEB7
MESCGRRSARNAELRLHSRIGGLEQKKLLRDSRLAASVIRQRGMLTVLTDRKGPGVSHTTPMARNVTSPAPNLKPPLDARASHGRCLEMLRTHCRDGTVGSTLAYEASLTPRQDHYLRECILAQAAHHRPAAPRTSSVC